MKKYLFLSLLLCSTLVKAHTGFDEKISCPICKKDVVFHQTMSMTTFGSYLDFQQYGAIGNYYEELINGCPRCYFSGYYNDYEKKYDKEHIDEIKKITATFKDQKKDDVLECEIAAALAVLSGDENVNVAYIYLQASYFLRTVPEKEEKRKEMQHKSIFYYQKALEKNELKKEEVANINYLIGELYRRTGSFKLAIEYFDKALADKNKPEWLEETAKKQKEMAKNKDDNNDI